jgi:hypothetical protein
MSLLDNVVNQELINIKLYYMVKTTKSGKKTMVIEDDKAEEMLKNPDKAKLVEVIDTWWKSLSWGEQKNLETIATDVNPANGEKSFNAIKFRDAAIKRCLKKWNLTIADKPVEVSPDLIDQLPAEVIFGLYVRFNTAISYTEDEMGN